MYFVYENWTNTFCNRGRGLFGGGKTPSGQWHSGFLTRDEALQQAQRLADAHANREVWDVRPCHFCCG